MHVQVEPALILRVSDHVELDAEILLEQFGGLFQRRVGASLLVFILCCRERYGSSCHQTAYKYPAKEGSSDLLLQRVTELEPADSLAGEPCATGSSRDRS